MGTSVAPTTSLEGDSRHRLRFAARAQFATRAYHDVTLRDIAEQAGVSAALVVKHFGSKEALFRVAADFNDDLEVLLAAPVEELGRHLVSSILAIHAQPHGADPFLALLLMASRKDAPPWVRRQVRTRFVQKLAARLDGADASLRAELVCGQLLGMSGLRRILRTAALTTAPPDDIVDLLAPAVQALLDGARS